MAHEHEGGGPHHHRHEHHHAHGDRHGARQAERFDPARAARLDDPTRLEYLPPDRILALMDPPAGGRVIDFGTGTGTFAFEIARRRPDLEIIALDEQPEMIEMLRAKPEAARFRNVVPTHTDDLPKLRGSADRVLMINVLHELGDEAMRSVAELLKADGRVLVVDWNGAIERPLGPPRQAVYTPEEARERLEKFGFQVSEAPPFKYHYALTASRRS